MTSAVPPSAVVVSAHASSGPRYQQFTLPSTGAIDLWSSRWPGSPKIDAAVPAASPCATNSSRFATSALVDAGTHLPSKGQADQPRDEQRDVAKTGELFHHHHSPGLGGDGHHV
jgi:hypothetical protein